MSRAEAAIARVPTAVERPSDVAGYGPPWTIDGQTSTPVEKPLKISRPTLVSRMRDEVGVLGEVLFGAVNGGSELALERVCYFEQFVMPVGLYQ